MLTEGWPTLGLPYQQERDLYQYERTQRLMESVDCRGICIFWCVLVGLLFKHRLFSFLASDGRMIVNDKLEMLLREAIVKARVKVK
jgi:hypothetical protein